MILRSCNRCMKNIATSEPLIVATISATVTAAAIGRCTYDTPTVMIVSTIRAPKIMKYVLTDFLISSTECASIYPPLYAAGSKKQDPAYVRRAGPVLWTRHHNKY